MPVSSLLFWGVHAAILIGVGLLLIVLKRYVKRYHVPAIRIAEGSANTKALQEAATAFEHAAEFAGTSRSSDVGTNHNPADSEKLRLAIDAYATDLKEFKASLDQVVQKDDLGGRLAHLAELDTTEGKFDEAIHMYRAALDVYLREQQPLPWASIQARLASIFVRLQERRQGSDSLRMAVASYAAAYRVLSSVTGTHAKSQ